MRKVSSSFFQMLVPFRGMRGRRKEVGRKTDIDFPKGVGLEIIKGVCEPPPCPLQSRPCLDLRVAPPCNKEARCMKSHDGYRVGEISLVTSLWGFQKDASWTFFSFGFTLDFFL